MRSGRSGKDPNSSTGCGAARSGPVRGLVAGDSGVAGDPFDGPRDWAGSESGQEGLDERGVDALGIPATDEAAPRRT